MQVKVPYVKKRIIFNKVTKLTIRVINITSVIDCIDNFKE